MNVRTPGCTRQALASPPSGEVGLGALTRGAEEA